VRDVEDGEAVFSLQVGDQVEDLQPDKLNAAAISGR
jgi:hypothetical protein